MLAARMGRGDLYLSLALLVAGRAEVMCAGTSKINGHALFQLEFKLDADSIQTRV